MKKNASPLLALTALILMSCTKDDIDIDIPLPDNDDPTAVSTDDSAGENIVTDKDDDNVSNSTFDRTVKIVFSGNGATVPAYVSAEKLPGECALSFPNGLAVLSMRMAKVIDFMTATP